MVNNKNKSGDNLREYSRLNISFDVNVDSGEGGTIKMSTRDMSDGGLFLKAEKSHLTVGSTVDVQVMGAIGGGEAAPIVKMQVRWIGCDGYGLEFIGG